VSQHALSVNCTSFKMKSQACPPAHHAMKVYLRRGSISPFIPPASRSRRFTTRELVVAVQNGRRSPIDLLCSLQPDYKETAITTVSYLWLADIRCFAVTCFTNIKILFVNLFWLTLLLRLRHVLGSILDLKPAILNEVFFLSYSPAPSDEFSHSYKG
jgi:hypothetical protein